MSRFALLLGMLCCAAVATSAEPSIRTGVYSNMSFEVEDLIGMEVFITYSRDGYHALVQCSAAEPNAPELVPLKSEGKRISFVLSSPHAADCGGTEFRGTIVRGVLTGSFAGSPHPVKLRRRASYWQQ